LVSGFSHWVAPRGLAPRGALLSLHAHLLTVPIVRVFFFSADAVDVVRIVIVSGGLAIDRSIV
jgi:hypothetical protein